LRRRAGVDDGAVAAAAIPSLVEGLKLHNEFDGASPARRGTIAFLRRRGATPGHITDDDVHQAHAVIHVAATVAEPVDEFCAELARVLGELTTIRTLRGVVQPKNYTGAAMNNFAYARQVVQRPGPLMPNAFLVPMSKTAAWWDKGWMERHTYFLPRFDDEGRMLSEGHALASEVGIACLLRRTYRHPTERAPAGSYDFLTYFECADADIPTFHQVCANLRDVKRNPEWAFVREGPTWQGLRVREWRELFSDSR